MLNQYQHIKKANPKFPILIRECSGAEARLIARYGNSKLLATLLLFTCCGVFPHTQLCFIADYGVEQAVPVNGLDSKAIESKLQELIERGESLPRFGVQASPILLLRLADVNTANGLLQVNRE